MEEWEKYKIAHNFCLWETRSLQIHAPSGKMGGELCWEGSRGRDVCIFPGCQFHERRGFVCSAMYLEHPEHCLLRSTVSASVYGINE